MYEVIWHGRGGQGVVIASQILAESAYLQGFKGVTSAPTFGPERRGAPLTASTRISDTPIRTFSQINKADIAVVLDPSLLAIVDILGSLKPNGLLLINTPQKADEVQVTGCCGIRLRLICTQGLGTLFEAGRQPRNHLTAGNLRVQSHV